MSPNCRLAICHDGNFLQAYIAEPGTMEGAAIIGTINKCICDLQPDLYNRWQALMVTTATDMIQHTFGAQEVEVRETDLPLSERAGNC